MRIYLMDINKFINEGTFQEYDYNNETKECEWKQIYKKSNETLKARVENNIYENEIIKVD